MPRQVQRGVEALALAKHYSLKGKIPLQLDEIIVPVHIVGELRNTDDAKPAGVNFSSPAPAAGDVGCVGIENPLGSSTLVEIERYEAVHASDLLVFTEVPGPGGLLPAATSTAGLWRDTRLEGSPTARGVALTVTPPAPFNGPFWRLIENHAFHNWQDGPPVYVSPGCRFWLVGTTVTVAFNAAIAWSERELEPSDL